MYSTGFEPIVKVGETVLKLDNKFSICSQDPDNWFIVEFIEPLPSHRENFAPSGGIASGATDTDNEVTELYVNECEFAQWRFWPVDDIRVVPKQPQGVSKYYGETFASYVDPYILAYENSAKGINEIYIWEDDTVYWDITNKTDSTLTLARVDFSGYRFVLKPAGFTKEQLRKINFQYTAISFTSSVKA